jgi:hypothetical protein
MTNQNEQYEPLTVGVFNEFCKGLDQRLMRMEAAQIETNAHLKELNGSVGNLKEWQHKVIGAVGVILFLLGTLGATLLGYVLVKLE